MLTVACVLKSGGDYDWEYVERLRIMIKRYLSYDCCFICFTDIERPISIKSEAWPIRIEYLQSSFQSYWAKLEVFRLKGEVLYFDLDTIVLNDLNPLVEGIRIMTSFNRYPNTFFMMRSFSRHRRWASGVMAWNGDFEFLYNCADENIIRRYGKWEQDYIVDLLCSYKIKINFINDCMSEKIRSYKHECLNGIPDNTGIICFHGKPRPREVGWLEGAIAAK